MGPAMWPSNLDDFTTYGLNAHKVHLDMLHSTPRCMGIAASGGNTFYTFDGYYGTIEQYDFGMPHPDGKDGHGGNDHKDGFKRRFPEVKVKRVAGVPSNMVYELKSGWLYIADSGNNRVIRVNTSGATQGKKLQSFPQDGVLYEFNGVKQETVTSLKDGLVDTPSGLALHAGTLYVADNKIGRIHAFDPSGKHLGFLDSGLESGSIGGMTAGPDNRLYFVDQKKSRVMRLEY
jgi:hypothetical protein